jgi:hypothetical protein
MRGVHVYNKLLEILSVIRHALELMHKEDVIITHVRRLAKFHFLKLQTSANATRWGIDRLMPGLLI